jgi:phage terminase small subunit
MASGKKKRHKTDPPPLTVKQIKFCQLWVETGNALRSYIDAGLPAKNNNTAGNLSFTLLKNPKVREYIRELQSIAADAAKMTVERIAAGMAKIATADRRKLYDKKGRILPPDQWPDDVADTIEGIESEEVFENVADTDPETGKKVRKRKELVGYTRKVKTASRMQAWAKLAEWKRMTGGDKTEPEKGKDERIVVKGEADPDKL